MSTCPCGCGNAPVTWEDDDTFRMLGWFVVIRRFGFLGWAASLFYAYPSGSHFEKTLWSWSRQRVTDRAKRFVTYMESGRRQ
jgi:hypothetical protein